MAKCHRAFTLVEVLVALSIVASSMVFLLVIRNQQLDGLERALDRSRASELAVAELARVASDPNEASTVGLHSGAADERFLLERSLTRVWIGGVPANVVSVAVRRGQTPFGPPLVAYCLCLPERELVAAEGAQ